MAIRVMVVDDSAFTRKVLREVLERAPGIEVVDIARDGLEALEKIAERRPDVITLDLVMPNLDGLGVLRALPKGGPPRAVVVSISDAESDLGLEALELGAVDLVQKPTALATGKMYELSDELVRKVTAAAVARVPVASKAHPLPRPAGVLVAQRTSLVVVGTSTGGPQALTRLLSALPGNFPVPVVAALHIPAGYTDALARRLDDHCALTVVEASEGLVLEPGMAVLAVGGKHLEVRRDGPHLRVHPDAHPAVASYRPSVDLLFESAAKAAGPGVVGVVLTGMGDDGLAGSRAIRAAGGRVLTESEATSVVYGMPRVVSEAGLSDAELPLDAMAQALIDRL